MAGIILPLSLSLSLSLSASTLHSVLRPSLEAYSGDKLLRHTMESNSLDDLQANLPHGVHPKATKSFFISQESGLYFSMYVLKCQGTP